MNKQKILIVDDDENIAELISLYLTKECFDMKQKMVSSLPSSRFQIRDIDRAFCQTFWQTWALRSSSPAAWAAALWTSLTSAASRWCWAHRAMPKRRWKATCAASCTPPAPSATNTHMNMSATNKRVVQSKPIAPDREESCVIQLSSFFCRRLWVSLLFKNCCDRMRL